MITKDKRSYRRVLLSVPLQYKNHLDSRMDLKGALTENLSEGGVNFRSTEFIDRAETLTVEILASLTSNPIKAVSKVTWVRKVKNDDSYSIGTRFVEMGSIDRLKLKRLSM